MRHSRVGAFAATLLACSAVQALPKGPTGLDVLPSLLEISVRPGVRVEKSVTLTNPTPRSLAVSARVSDWRMSESGEVDFSDPGTQPFSCARWIGVEPEAVVVPARGQTTMKVIITTSADFSGTRWAAVLFVLEDVPGLLDGRPVTFAGRVGLTIYLSAEGTEREGLTLAGCSASSSAGRTLLQASFENTGNTAVRIRLTWQVRSLDGRVVGTYTLRAVSLPGSRRVATFSTNDVLSAGTFKVAAMARWGAKRWQASDCELVVPARTAATS